MNWTWFFRGLSALIVLGLGISCAESRLQYHAQRQEIVKTKQVKMFDLCNHYDRSIRKFCRDEFGFKRANNLFDFIREHVPQDYFDPNASQDYFQRDASETNPKLPSHLRPRVEVTSISENPAGKPDSLNIASLPSALHNHVVEQLMRQDQGGKDVIRSLKNLEVGLGEIIHSKIKEGYPRTTPPLKQDLRLLINTSLNSAHIGDRLEKSYVFIFIPEGAHFETVDPIDTKKLTVTLGKETTKTETTASVAGVVPIPSPSSVSPQLSHKWERSLERELQQQLAERTVALNAPRDVLFASLEGIEGVDPGGNLAVSVTVGLDQNQLDILTIVSEREPKTGGYETIKREGLAGDQKWHIQKEPVILLRDLTAVVVWYVQARVIDTESSWNWIPDNVPLLGDLKYRSSGAHTVSEADDIVKPHVFSAIYPITLWINPWQFYHIVLPNREMGCRYLTIKEKSGHEGRAAFKRFDDALEFRQWLRDASDNEILRQFEITFYNPSQKPREQELPAKKRYKWEHWDMDKNRLRILYKSSTDQQPSIGQENACYSEGLTS
jgi:hypothetical protein